MESLRSTLIGFLGVLLLFAGCQKKYTGDDTGSRPPDSGPVESDVEFYLTQPDQFQLFKKQQVSLLFSSAVNQFPVIQLDETRTYQTIEGFGYSLTGGSAMLINALPAKEKDALLKELFLPDGSGIGISYLRISLGASDLSMVPFTYDDMPAGQTDPTLKNFTLDRERTDLIPLLKQVLALNPEIRLMASPWTAPVWMKTNNSFVGGSLRPEYYGVYARYLVKYLQEMEASGISIDALTPQNEPLHGGNNPSMVMQASEQAAFIRDHLGPALETAGLKTKIIIYDHNADRPDYPISVLNDPEARKYVAGSAFHLYGGSISALSTVHQAYPDKGIYFTEQWVGGPGNFGGDLQWHVTNLIIGATRNWSRNVLEWNLAADPQYKPHTNGGCTNCEGAITIGNDIRRNVSYYIIAHASKFVRPGSLRIETNVPAGLPNVAFRTPEGKKVLIAINTGAAPATFNIKHNDRSVVTSLNPGSVGTYVW